jgi:hypothetical protein
MILFSISHPTISMPCRWPGVGQPPARNSPKQITNYIASFSQGYPQECVEWKSENDKKRRDSRFCLRWAENPQGSIKYRFYKQNYFSQSRPDAQLRAPVRATVRAPKQSHTKAGA